MKSSPPEFVKANRIIGEARISALDVFDIQLPATIEPAASQVTRYRVVEVVTDANVTGYSFTQANQDGGVHVDNRPLLRSLMVGRDLFGILPELAIWRAGGAVEHALWDTIGKLVGQPVHRLLGGGSRTVKAYATCVWPGPLDQSGISADDQALMAVRLRDAGFKGMKIRIWRPDPDDDIHACSVIRAAVGPEFAIMVDRTAHLSGRTWDVDTAVKVAHGLEKVGVEWLEEPLDRADLDGLRRLSDRVVIPIAGGEAYRELTEFREALTLNAFDIIQPDAMHTGGVLPTVRVGTLAEAFDTRCVPHGSNGLALAGWLQVASVLRSEWQEIALVKPPILPEEQWEPALAIIRTDSLFKIREGEIEIPQAPGLGLNVDKHALDEYRVPVAG